MVNFLTALAWGPLGPWVTSNSTKSPSVKERKPSPSIAEWWTKTSPPSSCVMNP